jgi:hypothetical protein
MNQSRWKNEIWFVSFWNYLDEIRSGFVPPPNQLKIHDLTLRGAEQGYILF